MIRNSFFILVLILTSCTSRNPEEISNPITQDTSGRPPAFNANEELYIVFKIGSDTTDPNGNKCKNVEMKSASDKYFTSCIGDDLPAIGDSIWIGYDKSGMPYMLSMNN